MQTVWRKVAELLKRHKSAPSMESERLELPPHDPMESFLQAMWKVDMEATRPVNEWSAPKSFLDPGAGFSGTMQGWEGRLVILTPDRVQEALDIADRYVNKVPWASIKAAHGCLLHQTVGLSFSTPSQLLDRAARLIERHGYYASKEGGMVVERPLHEYTDACAVAKQWRERFGVFERTTSSAGAPQFG